MRDQIDKISLLVSRFFAFLLDFLIVLFLAFFYSKYFVVEFENNFLINTIQSLLIFQFYFFIFELLFGATLGKIIFGLRVNYSVKNLNHSKVRRFFDRLYNLFIRNFLRVLIFIPPLFIWNEILILIFSNGKSLSEIITKVNVEFKL